MACDYSMVESNWLGVLPLCYSTTIAKQYNQLVLARSIVEFAFINNFNDFNNGNINNYQLEFRNISRRNDGFIHFPNRSHLVSPNQLKTIPL